MDEQNTGCQCPTDPTDIGGCGHAYAGMACNNNPNIILTRDGKDFRFCADCEERAVGSGLYEWAEEEIEVAGAAPQPKLSAATLRRIAKGIQVYGT